MIINTALLLLLPSSQRPKSLLYEFNPNHLVDRGLFFGTPSESIVATPNNVPASTPMPPLSAEDLVVGSGIAIALALLASLLNSFGRSNIGSSTNVLDETNSTSVPNASIVFERWDQMKRPENYILYTTRLRKPPQGGKKEQKWVILALLALFVPIFSFELFLAVSRQVICGPILTDQMEWARFLCSPYIPE